MKKAVLFDLDGTLIDSSEGVTRSVQYALAHFGIQEEDLIKLRPFIGPPLIDSFMKYYHFSQEQAKEAVGVYRDRYRVKGIYECRLYPGVEQCIRRLKEQGCLIGMASSKPEEYCRRILEHFDILSLFDDVVGATLDGRINEKEEVLNEVFRRWDKIAKKDMVLIGDTMFDVAGANKADIECIAVSFGFGNVQEMLAAGAVASCDSMDEVSEVILRCN